MLMRSGCLAAPIDARESLFSASDTHQVARSCTVFPGAPRFDTEVCRLPALSSAAVAVETHAGIDCPDVYFTDARGNNDRGSLDSLERHAIVSPGMTWHCRRLQCRRLFGSTAIESPDTICQNNQVKCS